MQRAAAVHEPQFDIARHYDVMAQLDRDVHDDHRLSASEVDSALHLIGSVPERVLLPCCGTGRHIPRLLERGVCEIVGVDLSPACLAKARRQFGSDPRVSLIEADLRYWQTAARFDAAILLGNSFGDLVDPGMLLEVSQGMTRPLRSGGIMLMDYIGEAYLARIGQPTVWQAELDGQSACDTRTPRYDLATRILTIGVVVRHASTDALLWEGSYQKRILDPSEVVAHFAACGVHMLPLGAATDLNHEYYRGHEGELGMIARSTWWVGIKE